MVKREKHGQQSAIEFLRTGEQSVYRLPRVPLAIVIVLLCVRFREVHQPPPPSGKLPVSGNLRELRAVFRHAEQRHFVSPPVKRERFEQWLRLRPRIGQRLLFLHRLRAVLAVKPPPFPRPRVPWANRLRVSSQRLAKRLHTDS